MSSSLMKAQNMEDRDTARRIISMNSEDKILVNLVDDGVVFGLVAAIVEPGRLQAA